MTPEQQQIRDGALKDARDYGFTRPRDWVDGALRAPLGKFEGENYYALYFYDQALTGMADEPLYQGDSIVGDLLEVTEDERIAFSLNAATAFVVLWYSEQGFVQLRELTAAEYDYLRAKFETTDDDGAQS